jgi:cyanuric acid amidohydrolase
MALGNLNSRQQTPARAFIGGSDMHDAAINAVTDAACKAHLAEDTRPLLSVHRLDMAHPGDVSALEYLLDRQEIKGNEIVAIIGKTEGNGGVNDFTRGFFTQSLMSLLSPRLGRTPAELLKEIPLVFSGGTEGVLTPHYVVFSRRGELQDSATKGPQPGVAALAIGTALSTQMQAQDIGRAHHVRMVADTVRMAMHKAGITHPEDVVFVQVKAPCITSAKARVAAEGGHSVVTTDPGKSMSYARAVGALGAALALGEIADDEIDAILLQDMTRGTSRASASSGVEVESNEVVVLGHSTAWRGPLRMGCAPMADALDIQGVGAALEQLGMRATPQLSAHDADRIVGVFVKCEPDPSGRTRGARHTMLDDTDINAQRHIRAALGGLVGSVLGNPRIFISGGAEHQGPVGGGLIGVIAHVG